LLAGHIVSMQANIGSRCRKLLIIGVPLIAAGLICNIWLPINKKLWTDSFTLFMAGLDFVLFAGFLWLIDGLGYRRAVKPLVIMGMNAIAIYMASELVDEALGGLHLKAPLYNHLFAPLASPYNASLLYAVAYVLAMYLFGWVLYRRSWFIRV
jgi:predicted acyltransferase